MPRLSPRLRGTAAIALLIAGGAPEARTRSLPGAAAVPPVAAGARERSVNEPSHVRGAALIAEALAFPSAWARLRVLTDTVGHRLAGSAAEPKAVAWARGEFEKDRVRVWLEPVSVPVWIRGQESAEIVAPAPQPLVILGLGGTVGTPPGGITASLLVVGSIEELSARSREDVEGRIVLFDAPFPRTGDELADYGVAVKPRSQGASEAARLGAVGALVRSVATASLRTPHTGGLHYAAEVPRIPAAAVTIEDAMLLRRLVDAGHDVRVRLSLGARTEPDREGANVIAEIRGREKPGEIVLIGAHLDSWDVGAGAIDDGAGCVMVLETMRLLASGPPPRRTVRAVLFANEENGLRGGKAYRAGLRNEMAAHVAAIETDAGAGRSRGMTLKAGDGGLDQLRALLAPVLAQIGAGRIRAGEGGADIGPLAYFGVPLLDHDLDTSRYFDWHHTWADTLDKVDPDTLQQATAALAATTWVLAETRGKLPRVPPLLPLPRNAL